MESVVSAHAYAVVTRRLATVTLTNSEEFVILEPWRNIGRWPF